MPENEIQNQKTFWDNNMPDWRNIQGTSPLKPEIQTKPIADFYRVEGIRGIEGLKGLPEEERDEWKRRMQSKNPTIDWGNLSDTQIDNIFQERRIINRYGLDNYNKYGPEALKEEFNRESAYYEAAEKYQDEDPDTYNRILIAASSAKTEDILDFIDSYDSIKDIEQQEADLRKAYENSIMDATTRALVTRDVYNTRPSTALLNIEQTLRGKDVSEYNSPFKDRELKYRTDELTKFEKKAFDSLLTENQDKKEEIRNYLSELQRTDPEKFDNLFESIYSGNTKEIQTNYGSYKEVQPGINWYREFKNHGALRHFGADDKIDALANYMTITAALRDKESAKQAAELYMQDYVVDNQGWARNFWRRTYGLAPGIASYIASIIEAPVAAGLMVNDLMTGASALGAWVTPSDEKILKQTVLSPAYWQYVDQFNTFSSSKIVESIHNGGISRYAPQYHTTGDEGWRMLGEMYSMAKFIVPGMILGKVAPLVKMGPLTQEKLITWGSAGGIGASYAAGSAQTVAQQIDDEINRKINTDAYSTAKNLLQDENTQKEIEKNAREKMQADWEENQRKANKGKEGVPFVKMTEELEAEYLPYYINKEQEDFIKTISQQYKEDSEKAGTYDYAKRRKEKAVGVAYATTMLLETARMYYLIPAVKQFMYSPAARQLVETRKGFLRKMPKTQPSQIEAVPGENAVRLKNAEQLLKRKKWETLIGGFESNWVDEATHTLGESLGLSTFNNIIYKYEDPEGYIESYSGTLSPWIIATLKAFEDGIDKLSTVEALECGLIGAGGTVFGGVPKIGNIIKGISGKEISAPYDATVRGNKEIVTVEKGKQEENPLTFWQKFDLYWNTGLTSAIADHQWRQKYDPIVKTMNDVLSSDRYKNLLKDLHYVASAFNADELVDDIDVEGREDNKLRSVANIIYTINAMEEDGTLLDDIPQVKEVREKLNALLEGNITEQNIAEYLADDRNKDLNSIEDKEERYAKAREAIKENVEQFRRFKDNYTTAMEQLDNSATDFSLYGIKEGELIKHTIAASYALDAELQIRNSNLNEEISGNSVVNTQENPIAKYGNRKTWEQKLQSAREEATAIRQEIKKIDKEIDKVNKEASKSLKKALKEKKENRLNDLNYEKSILKKQLNQWEYEARKIKADESLFENSDTVTDVLTEEEILNLSPLQRWEMLRNKDRYSQEQQQVIDDLISKKEAEDADFMDKVTRSANEWVKYEHNKEAYERLRTNVPVAVSYLRGLESRRTMGLLRANIFIKTQQLNEALDKIDVNSKTDDGKSVLAEMVKMMMSRENSPDPERIADYIKHRPEAEPVLKDLQQAMELVRDLRDAADVVVRDGDMNRRIRGVLGTATQDANTADEVNVGIEKTLQSVNASGDIELTETLRNVVALAKAARDSRNSTNTETAETKKERKLSKREAEKQAKKDAGINYHWKGYAVGYNVFSKATGQIGTVVEFGFRGKDGEFKEEGRWGQKGVMRVRWSDGTISEYDQGKDEKNDSIEHLGVDRQKAALERERKRKESKAQQNPTPKGVTESGSVETDDGYWLTPDSVVVNSEYNAADFKDASEVQIETVDEDDDAVKRVVDKTKVVSIGGRLYEWDTESLKDYNGRRMIRDTKAGEDKKNYWKLSDEKGWKIQKIKDDELWRIREKNPDTQLHLVNISRTQHPELSNVKLLAIELTPEVAKIHKKENGGVIESRGKKWLIVGEYGYASETNPEAYNRQVEKSNSINWETTTDDEFFVEDTYTQVKEIKTTQLTQQLPDDETSEFRSVLDLMNDPKRNNGVTLDNAAWMIETRSTPIFINVGDRKVMRIRAKGERSGNAFLLAPASNGKLVPIYMRPVNWNDVRPGIYRDEVEASIRKLASNDAAVREEGRKEIQTKFVLTKESGIYTSKDGKTITFRDKGSVLKVLKIDEISPSKLFETFKEANFMMNVAQSDLMDETRIKDIAEAGLLDTDIAFLGTVNSSYDVYEIGSDGKPIITLEPENSQDEVEESNKTISGKGTRLVIWNGTSYKIRKGEVTNEKTKEVITYEKDPRLYTNIYYEDKIQQGNIQPFTESKDGAIYIIDSSETNPVVVFKEAGKNGNFREYTEKKALEIVKKQKSGILEKQRLANLKKAAESINGPTDIHNVFPEKVWWSTPFDMEETLTKLNLNSATKKFYEIVDMQFSEEEKAELAKVSDTEFMDTALSMVNREDPLHLRLLELKRAANVMSVADIVVQNSQQQATTTTKTTTTEKADKEPTSTKVSPTLSAENLMQDSTGDVTLDALIDMENSVATQDGELVDFQEAVENILVDRYGYERKTLTSQRMTEILTKEINKPIKEGQDLQEWYNDLVNC